MQRGHGCARVRAGTVRSPPRSPPGTHFACKHGGPLVMATREIGRLRVTSGRIVAADPMIILADGKPARLGPIELEVVNPDLHGDDTMRGLNVRLLECRGGPALRPAVLLLGFESAHWTRAGLDLLRIDEDPSRPTLKLRRFTLTCPAEHAIQAPPTAPIHLWLSTHGLVSVTIGDARAPALTLGMTTGLASPGLAFHSPRASLFESIAADLIGNAYSFDGWLVEVVDVQATGDARREGNSWLTAAPVPPLHVQLRVSPL